MSRGEPPLVQLRTQQEIELEAIRFRKKAFPDLPSGSILSHIVDYEHLLQDTMKRHYGVELDVVDDLDMPADFGRFRTKDNVIALRQTIMDKIRIRDPDACQIVWHEISHSLLHRNPVFNKSVHALRGPRKLRDPEWQADYGAMALAIGVDAALKYRSAVSLTQISGLPKAWCEWYLSERKIITQKNSAVHPHGTTLDLDLQCDFDSSD